MLTDQEIEEIKIKAKALIATYENPEDSLPAVTTKLEEAYVEYQAFETPESYQEFLKWERFKIELEFLVSKK
jgi:hypothetical protein